MALEEEPKLLNLCSRAMNSANSVSVHIVEYLDSSKSPNNIFRGLAINFLELCQTLWPIQSGFLNMLNTSDQFPEDVLTELETKVQQTIKDLISVDLLITKLLTYERKKGFSKFVKGLSLGSVEVDMMTSSAALGSDRDALRMASLALRWVLGNGESAASMGSAYVSLAKALKIQDNKKLQPRGERLLLPAIPEPEPARGLHVRAIQPTSPSQKGSLNTANFQSTGSVKHTSSYTTRNGREPLDRVKISSPTLFPDAGRRPPSLASIPLSTHGPRHTLSSKASFHTQGSGSDREDTLHNSSLETMARAHGHHKHSPPMHSVGPRSRPVVHIESNADKAALISAVQHGNHKLLEDLLEAGIHPASIAHTNLLSLAVHDSDVTSVELLLLFNADANRVDHGECSALLTATQLGSVEIAELLLKYKADPNMYSGPHDELPLVLAAQTGQRELVRLYLKYKADCNTVLPNGETVLTASITKDTDADIIKLMLDAGADADKKTKEGKTPLFAAVTEHRADIMEHLLDHGAKPNLAGPKHPLWPSTYYTPALQLLIARGAKPQMAPGMMELATSINNVESVKVLLAAGVSPNVKKDGIYTPLCSAIRDDRADLVSLLLSKQADPNLPASEYPCFKCITHGRLQYLTPLIAAGAKLDEPSGILETAVAHDSMEAAVFLVRNRVDVNARSVEGFTPLTTAIRKNHLRFVDYLLLHGASPTIRGEDWPLAMAVKHPPILKRILRDVSNPGTAKKGILELAVQAGQLDSVKLLVAAGVNVEDKTGGVFSPLTTAIREDKPVMVQYLLDEAGADINAPGEHLPLVKAIRRHTPALGTGIIEMLLERGADINLLYRGWNPVMQAIEKGDLKILQLLIEKGNGIDLEATDPESNKMIIDLVRDRGWQEGVAMLMDHQKQTRMITCSV